MNVDDQSDLFPDLPRARKKKVSYGEMLTTALNDTRMSFGVTMPQISECLQIPLSTLRKWGQGTNLPAEWTARLVLDALRKLFPR